MTARRDVVRNSAVESRSVREQVDGVPRLLVLAKVRRILDAFTTEQPELTVAQLAVRADLPVSTCVRFVRNLTHDGLLERTADERYRIGFAIIRWSGIALQSRDIIDVARPVLDWLRDESGESAMLCVRDGTVAVLVALANSRHSVTRQLRVGGLHALHAGSIGKIFAAFDPEVEDAITAQPLERFTERTIVDHDKLRAELETIRSRGYTSSSGERTPGASGVAAPVFDERAKLAASVGLTGPSSRMDDSSILRCIPLVVTAANRISSSLGYQGGPTTSRSAS